MKEKNDISNQVEEFYRGIEEGLQNIAEKNKIKYSDFLMHECEYKGKEIWDIRPGSLRYEYKFGKDGLEIRAYCRCGKYADVLKPRSYYF